MKISNNIIKKKYIYKLVKDWYSFKKYPKTQKLSFLLI